jgi:hypothetical protein
MKEHYLFDEILDLTNKEATNPAEVLGAKIDDEYIWKSD